jgi:threonyl-tRNA synthetase
LQLLDFFRFSFDIIQILSGKLKSGLVTARRRFEGDIGAMQLDDFIAMITKEKNARN